MRAFTYFWAAIVVLLVMGQLVPGAISGPAAVFSAVRLPPQLVRDLVHDLGRPLVIFVALSIGIAATDRAPKRWSP